MSATDRSAPQGLGFVGAGSLALTIVIGSGALVLPGIAYRQAGSASVWSWVLAALVVLPLLAVFGRLGRQLPGAAGLAGFMQAAFGRPAAAATEVLLIGTFGVGIPGIALTGGHYLAGAAGLPDRYAPACAVAMVGVAVVVNGLGVRTSGTVQTVLALLLTGGLVTIAWCGLMLAPDPQPSPALSVQALSHGLANVGVVFFAFTGWELVSCTTGEYANPRRDFPRVLAASYLIAVSAYVLLAAAVQHTLAQDTAQLDSQPIRLVVTAVSGPGLGRVVALTGSVVLLANVLGNTWGASRLVMSSATQGLLPSALAAANQRQVPHRAVVSCGAVFAAVIVGNALGWCSLSGLLSLAGKNFLLLYLACCLAHLRLFRSRRDRLVALAGIVPLIVFATTLGWRSLSYAASLLVVGAALARAQRRRAGRERILPELVTSEVRQHEPTAGR